MRQPAFVAASAQIDMYPRYFLIDKLAKKTRRVYVIATTISFALDQVGCITLKAGNEFIADRKRPNAFTALPAGTFQDWVQFRSI